MDENTMKEVNFKISKSKIVCEDLSEFRLDGRYLKANKFGLSRDNFPRSIFIKADSFKDYDLKDTCIVHEHVAYALAGVRLQDETIDSAVYWAGDDVPEILVYVGKSE